MGVTLVDSLDTVIIPYTVVIMQTKIRRLIV